MDVLFLCSGNYYRSRFAEEWFNHLSAQRDSRLTASSAGLLERCWAHNPGPISRHTTTALAELGVTPRGATRSPQDATEEQLRRAARIVALYRDEHEPMVRARFPDFIQRIEFWSCPDLDEVSPAICLPRIRQHVGQLLTTLSDGKRQAAPVPGANAR